MSNSIWKTPDQKPEENKQIIFYAGGGHYAYMGWYYKKVDMFGAWNASETQKWTYYDNLIAQADKAERLQKAVDLALGWLEKVATPAKCDDDLCREFTKRKIDEIKQLIKGE